jgi:hypothetical protein
MELKSCFPPLVESCTGYRVYFRSADDLWSIGTNPVLFGMRVIAFRDGSAGPVVDYCAGSDPIFKCQLLLAVAAIFIRHLPDGATEQQVLNLMPTWRTRPINSDPCWPKLQALAAGDPLV